MYIKQISKKIIIFENRKEFAIPATITKEVLWHTGAEGPRARI